MVHPIPLLSLQIPARRKLPAYARRVVAQSRLGAIPGGGQLVVGVGDWKLANPRRKNVIVVPPGESPSMFTWNFVEGLAVMMVVWEQDLDLAEQVAGEVIRAGSRGCAALIRDSRGRVGWRLYQSHLGGPNGR